jgi:hypothetical protein
MSAFHASRSISMEPFVSFKHSANNSSNVICNVPRLDLRLEPVLEKESRYREVRDMGEESESRLDRMVREVTSK